MGNGALPHGPSYRAHPRLYHRVESMRCEDSDAIGAKRTCRERRERVDLTKMPSRPGELHPEPLTDPDLTLSRHPARATARRLPPPVENWSSSCCQLARSQRR
jgi:hypothetical protein